MESLVGFAIGVAIGFVLERGQFCMASAFRDFFLFRHTHLLRAVMLYLALLTPAFFLLHSAELVETYPYVKNGGLFTVIGGVIFGIGMVLAGGCASGTLYRIGEGYVTSLVALIGMLVGIAIFGESYPWVLRALIAPTEFGKMTAGELLGITQLQAVVLGTLLFSGLYLLLGRRFRR
ncbi:MAG: YeeE/YedE family protein [Euryarchaeota archaeon]|nr:YeeE/YedE family protein [Euryarchaeota archaeon]